MGKYSSEMPEVIAATQQIEVCDQRIDFKKGAKVWMTDKEARRATITEAVSVLRGKSVCMANAVEDVYRMCEL
jgi:hypothetical protein